MFAACAILGSGLLPQRSLAAELGHELKPALGEPLVAHRGAALAPIIAPDGAGLPAGSGSVATGKAIFAARCSACHGADGQQAGNALVGGIGSLATATPLRTVGSYWPYATTLWDYINVAMPYGEQKSLSAEEVYAVTAYVLYLNAILGQEATLDAASLPQVRMPNRDGFVEVEH